MALINKTGITNGGTIQAEHVTRAIDALSGGSTDTVVATGSFSGSFKGDGSQLTGITGEWDGSLIGDALIVGKLSVTAGVTASLQGTASWANNSVTASYYNGSVISSSYATTASYINGAVLDSTATSRIIPYVSNSRLYNSNIYETATGDISIGTIGSSFGKLQVTQTSTGQNGLAVLFLANDPAQSAILVSAAYSCNLLSLTSNSGSFIVSSNGTTTITGSMQVSAGITSSLFGTASWANNAVTSSYVLNAVSSSFATSASRAVSAASATTASYLQYAVLQNGNSFGTTLTIGTDDANDFRLQASGSVAVTIDGNSAVAKGHVMLAKTGSAAYPALTFGNGTTSGIGFHDGGDSVSGAAISLSDGGLECASFQQGATGIDGYPVIVFGERQYFKNNDKWGQPGVHVQSGGVYADAFQSNFFYSGASSNWIKKNYSCGYWVNPTSSLEFWAAPTSSVTGSASAGVAPPEKFMVVDPNYESGGFTYPNVTISNRLSIGTLWGGTGTAIGRDATSGEIRATSSDQRLKTNIQTISGSLDIINALNGVQYEWTSENEPEFKIGTESTGSQIGLVAQQVQAVLPQVVKQSGFKDYLTIEYDKLVAVLIEGIKSQQQEIDTLKNELAAIKNHLGI